MYVAKYSVKLFNVVVNVFKYVVMCSLGLTYIYIFMIVYFYFDSFIYKGQP